MSWFQIISSKTRKIPWLLNDDFNYSAIVQSPPVPENSGFWGPNGYRYSMVHNSPNNILQSANIRTLPGGGVEFYVEHLDPDTIPEGAASWSRLFLKAYADAPVNTPLMQATRYKWRFPVGKILSKTSGGGGIDFPRYNTHMIEQEKTHISFGRPPVTTNLRGDLITTTVYDHDDTDILVNGANLDYIVNSEGYHEIAVEQVVDLLRVTTYFPGQRNGNIIVWVKKDSQTWADVKNNPVLDFSDQSKNLTRVDNEAFVAGYPHNVLYAATHATGSTRNIFWNDGLREFRHQCLLWQFYRGPVIDPGIFVENAND